MSAWLLLGLACAPPLSVGDTGGTVTLDTGPADTGEPLDCDYLDTASYAVDCAGSLDSLLQLESGDPDCPDQWQLHGARYDGVTKAILREGCDDTCVWGLSTAVMFEYCEARGEYQVFDAGGPGQTGTDEACGSRLHFESVAGSGWYEDFEAFTEDNPCP